MRLDPRRRFRDRLLVAMVAVALLPLAGFAILAAVELDSVSRTTASQAQGAILQDEQARQQTAEQSRAGLLEARIDGIDNELAALAEQVTHALSSDTAAAPPTALSAYRGALVSGGVTDPTSVITSTAPTADQIKLIDAGAALIGPMQNLKRDYPEVEIAWLNSTTGLAFRAVPGFDVKSAFDSSLLDPSLPQLRNGNDVFTPSQHRIDGSAPGTWVDPTSSANRTGTPYWTDAYKTVSAGGQYGVSAWMLLRDGHTRVGVDILPQSLLTNALTQPNATPFAPAAYPMLLSSDGSVVYADAAAVKDWTIGDDLKLALPKDAAFDRAFNRSLTRGDAGMLQTTLGLTNPVVKDVFSTPVYGPHWLLASPVPLADLQPDLTGLTYGIAAGVHALFPAVVLPVLVLLLGLAFVAATLVSRRLVGPVRNLTKAAEVLATGRTDVPVPPQGTDEVGVLATTMERMRGEINASRQEILAASAELEQRVDERTAELSSRNDELVALNDLAASLTRSLDAQVILTDALEALRAVHPLSSARGYVLEGDALVSGVTWALPGVEQADLTAALDALTTRAVTERHPVDVEIEGRTLLAWPLVTQQGAVGAIAVDAARRPQRTTRRLLQAIADQVALAMRTARLSAAGREHAVLEERTRLAREIHDTLAQQLTGIVLQLEAAETLIGRGSDRAMSSVSMARDLARSALQEARRSVWNLRPAPLATTGVMAAIEREVRALEERTGIATRFRARAVSARPALQPAAEVALLRIAQEALSNVARHSGATHVDVTVKTAGDELVLSVRDDGRGFDPAEQPARQDSFGLEGMRERVRLAGGSLVVVSSPHKGTEVTARVPLLEGAEVEHTA